MNWTRVLEEYKRIVENGNYDNITKIHCLSCVEESLKWLEKEENEETKVNMAQVVYDYWLDTDIQISQISDIVCENWKEYLKNEDFNIYDYVKEDF